MPIVGCRKLCFSDCKLCSFFVNTLFCIPNIGDYFFNRGGWGRIGRIFYSFHESSLSPVLFKCQLVLWFGFQLSLQPDR
ncbi:hypothetical protein EVA_15677 [gut metagenome]|uniref:Uncharacterized protein n=1 Tax=gut metagenome TaxID=749906 RepID=J9FMR4_9ZZZZ